MSKNHQEAICTLIIFFKENLDSKKLIEQLQVLKGLADQGIPEACILYSGFLLNGIGVEKDLKLGAEFLKRCENAPNNEVLNAQAVCLLFGWGELQNTSLAIQKFNTAIEFGSVSALNNLGWCQLYGIGVQKDQKAAAQNFRRAMDLGLPEGLLNYAWCLLNGFGINISSSQAKQFFNRASQMHSNFHLGFGLAYGYLWNHNSQEANLLNPEEVCNLADCYFEGWGVQQDYTQALELFKRVESQSTTASLRIMRSHINGWGTEINRQASHQTLFRLLNRLNQTQNQNTPQLMPLHKTLFTILQKSVEDEEKGSPHYAELCYNLGLFYLQGKGTLINNDEAVRLLLCAAEKRYTLAYSHLAHYYKEAIGTESSLTQAVHWSVLSAQNQELSAIQFLAKLLLESSSAPTLTHSAQALTGADRKLILDTFLSLGRSRGVFINNGAIQAIVCECLGKCFFHGMGVTINKKLAFDYFLIASRIDGRKMDPAQFLKSQEHLSDIDNEAFGQFAAELLMSENNQDQTQAIQFLRAMEDKMSYALNTLGVCNIVGLGGVKADRKKALLKFTKAANQGSVEALNNWGWCLLLGLGTPIDIKAAAEKFKIAMDKGSLTATLNFAWCLLNDLGIPPDQNLEVANAEDAHIVPRTLSNSDKALKLFSEASERAKQQDQPLGFGLCFGGRFQNEGPLEVCIKDNFKMLKNLALCYWRGWGVEKNHGKSITLFRTLHNVSLHEAGPILLNTEVSGIDLKEIGEVVSSRIEKETDSALLAEELLLLGLITDNYSLLEKSANLGNIAAYHYMALGCLKGYSTEINIAKAQNFLEIGAQKGDLQSCLILAHQLLTRLDDKQVSEHRMTAFTLLRKAEALPSGKASNLLGICYFKGWGVKADHTEAVRKFRSAIQKGCTDAENNLAWLFYLNSTVRGHASSLKSTQSNNNTESQLKECIELLESAADKGSIMATINLAWCTYNGIGVTANIDEAIALFSQAKALQTDFISPAFKAGFELGLTSEDSLEKLFSEHPNLITNLAVCYLNGLGVEKDLMKAVKLFHSISPKSVRAVFALALCYLNGLGVEKDPERVYQNVIETLYRIAIPNNTPSKKGNIVEEAMDLKDLAITLLARCYLLGIGVEKDEQIAVELLYQTAVLGDPEATLLLGRIHDGGIGVPQNRDYALQCYQCAVELGHPKAQLYLSELLEEIEENSKGNTNGVTDVGDSKKSDELKKTSEMESLKVKALSKSTTWSYSAQSKQNNQVQAVLSALGIAGKESDRNHNHKIS